MAFVLIAEYMLSETVKKKSDIKIKSSQFLVKKTPKSEEKPKTNEFDMICRVCTKAADIPLTDKVHDMSILNAITTICNITVFNTKAYPQYICKTCLEELKLALSFKRKCEASDLIFRKSIKHQQLLANSDTSSSSQMIFNNVESKPHKMKQHRERPLDFATKTNNDTSSSSQIIFSNVESAHNKIKQHRERPLDIPTKTNNDTSSSSQMIFNNVESAYNKMKQHRERPLDFPTKTNNDTSSSSQMIFNNVESAHNKIKQHRERPLDFPTKTNNDTSSSSQMIFNNVESTHNKMKQHRERPLDSPTKSTETFPIESKPRIYTICRRCKMPFTSKTLFIEHSKKECLRPPCPMCGKRIMHLSKHIKIVHSNSNNFTCHICGKTAYTAASLRDHLTIHSNTFDFACHLCPYKCKLRNTLKVHMRTHTGERPFSCSSCPAKFGQSSNLKKHQLIHLSKEHECSKCKKRFRTQKILKDHYDAAHLNIRYRCSICGRDVFSRRRLLRHELRMHKREKRKFFEEAIQLIVNDDSEI